jgi:hypothetical protein
MGKGAENIDLKLPPAAPIHGISGSSRNAVSRPSGPETRALAVSTWPMPMRSGVAGLPVQPIPWTWRGLLCGSRGARDAAESSLAVDRGKPLWHCRAPPTSTASRPLDG